jgi:hypothetical protein
MAYRTKKKPGGKDRNGNPLLGLKITDKAEMAISANEPGAWKAIDKARDGSAATNNGTYNINGRVCFHTKAGSNTYAVAWWSDPSYVYVEALIRHIGAGNQYVIV